MSRTIRKPYSEKVPVVKGFSKPSMSQQALKNETDINKIMAKVRKTRQMPLPVHSGQLQFGDFSQVTDYQSARNAVIEAQRAFIALPSAIRTRFENDPHKLLVFLSDDKNRAEAIRLGLVKAEEPKVSHGNGGAVSEPPPNSTTPSV